MNDFQTRLKRTLTSISTIFTLLITVSCNAQVETTRQSYDEKHRPQVHFTPPSQWMNDPNGMVYYDGEYHLFYQHYPDSNVWGPMHWGHAISKDLVSWQQLPIALYPDDNGMIFSGSAVMDLDNTSGLGTAANPPMVAIFTYHDPKGYDAGRIDFQTQGIAYSLDKGRSWTKYEGNPVVANPGIRDFRDPKVIWYEKGQKWIMSLAVWDHVSFYSSQNLIDWTKESDFGLEYGSHGGVWECPDLFPMTDENGLTRWVLFVSINPGGPNGGSATQYFIGDFDGTRFTLDPELEDEFGVIPAYNPNGYVFEDFESGYSKWLKEGDAFGDAPAMGPIGNQNTVGGFTGEQFVNSYNNGDQGTGKLTSVSFKITRPYINFLKGGGNNPGKTCMNLIVEGEIVRTISGDNNEDLALASWNVEEYLGKKGKLEIVDSHAGGWGHINIDHIVFAHEAVRPALEKSLWLDYGTDNYAGVTWSNVPDERTLFIGWMSNWQYAILVPTQAWRSTMTVSRELNLRSTPDGYRMNSVPVSELEAYRSENTGFENVTFSSTYSLRQKNGFKANVMDIDMDINMINASSFSVSLTNIKDQYLRLTLDKNEGLMILDRTNAGESDFHSEFAKVQEAPFTITQNINLRIIVDVASMEVFVNQGDVVMTAVFFPDEVFDEVVLESDGQTFIKRLDAYELKGIWK